MIGRILNLRTGESRQLAPFFVMYLTLFAALTLADGFSLALFIQRVGAGRLPAAYAAIAVLNLAAVAIYLAAGRAGAERVFYYVIGFDVLVYTAGWAVVRFTGLDALGYAAFFIAREIYLTLVMLHFGTYLQDYFAREQMTRVLPIVYAGGRLGGIVGALLLSRLPGVLKMIDLAGVVVGLNLVAAVMVWRTSAALRALKQRVSVFESKQLTVPTEAEIAARSSARGFARYLWHSPLLFWLSAASVLFILLRWVLNYQYNHFFDDYFRDAAGTARFLGLYTQYALAASLAMQLLLISRLIGLIGVAGVHLLYSAAVAAAVVLNVFPMTLGAAVFARLVETELRFGVRNPVVQLITNRFSKPMRVRVRSWTLGLLIPVGTLIASGVLALLTGRALAWAAVGAAAAYLVAALRASLSPVEPRVQEKTDASTLDDRPRP